MELRERSRGAVCWQKVSELGLDPDRFDLVSVEAISAAVRRVSGFLCPCPASAVVRAVVTPLRGLVEDVEEIRAKVEATLEAMVAYGDLLEFREIDAERGEGRVLLFTAPAAFVPRDTGAQFLVGIWDDQLSPFPEDLASRIDVIRHTRQLNPEDGENLHETLKQHGLVEIPFEDWSKAPEFSGPAALIARYKDLLDVSRPSGDVPGLQLLDPERPVSYYRGRWVAPDRRSGRFVARRHQAYGAPLWCYVQLTNGEPQALVDLPLTKSRWRGCDEAWHLQMAIDASRASPQKFEVRPGSDGTRTMTFFSPVPMWAQRRWDTIGERISGERCLFAYRVPKDELPQELRFIRRVLWLDQLENGGG